ncbi:uncharacterized protein K460DRAFT_363633 [Cucurbitaria berberidis CBS 394.84]|uniref:Uncharacterized protein n=1 Tax=Cucurbitaria berberidis CBS 394.84 TaxID=1168544 RepID=A0A9P4L9S6_9PLEO|nr:uncharacterized protein K460DRAFT_363633 [Cucurbitaria berberidis CBS 394.84]KAF1847566.1 hypothetical protein K460DRAFT_363633 [Cucurbitaria berberidis CBS 394.84]
MYRVTITSLNVDMPEGFRIQFPACTDEADAPPPLSCNRWHGMVRCWQCASGTGATK